MPASVGTGTVGKNGRCFGSLGKREADQKVKRRDETISKRVTLVGFHRIASPHCIFQPSSSSSNPAAKQGLLSWP